MLARLFVIFGGLFVLALTAVLVAPYVVDWSSYRADFEREASVILGRKVIVHGEATATILPFPSVTFSDVEVDGGPNGEPAMTAETFSMDAELAPLLSGEFRIFDMRLVRPRVTIGIAADGTVDWAMRPSSPPTSPFDASQISIEKLTITKGEVDVVHAGSGRTHRLSEVNTELSARSLAGPWRMVGTMRIDGWDSAVTVNTGRAGGEGMRLRVHVEPEARKVAIETEGELRFEGALARYGGEFKLASRKDASDAPSSGPGFRVRGKFALDERRLALDEFRFETGPTDNPYSADGSGFLDFGSAPRFALTLDGAQVRLDDAVGAGVESAGLTFAQRLDAFQEVLLGLPEATIPGTIEVSLPAVVAGDTMIREVKLSAEPAADGWTIKSLAATLPGRTTLEASGTLRTDNELGFAGSLLLAIAQPSGFAAWVSRDVDDAIRRLPAAGFSADVDLTQSRQSFKSLELGLGGAVFRGEAERTTPANADPATVLKLEGGQVDLDGLAALGSLFVSDTGVNRFAEGDLDLELKAGPASAGGFTARSVDTALRLRGGTLEVDRLSIGDVEGATISATGTLRDFPENFTGYLDASVVSVDLAPLIAAASERYGDNPLVKGLHQRAQGYRGLFTDARFDLVATSALNPDGSSGVAVSAQGQLGGTALSATLTGRGRLEQLADVAISVALSGRSSDAGELMALYGFSVMPLGLVGSGESDLSLKGNLSGDLDTALAFVAGDFSASFNGTTRLSDGVATSGRAHLVAPDIEPWLMTAGVALPGMGIGLPLELESDIDFQNGSLSLKSLAGTVNQGSVDGDIEVALGSDKPRLTGSLALDELNLEPFGAMVLGETALQGLSEGASQAPFAPKVSAPFAAEVDVSAGTMTAGPGVTAYDATLKLLLDDENLRLSDLSASLYDGRVSGLVELKNSAGTGLFSSQLKFENVDMRSVLGNVGLSGRSDLSTVLSASGKTVGGLVATLSGSGSAAFRSLVVEGVNADALPALIARADLLGNDIDTDRTAAFAPSIVTAGNFRAEPADAAFTVAAGVVRSPPVTLRNSAATIEANVQSDLNTGEVSASGTISYVPGSEALVGSEPAVRFSLRGPIGATVASFDSQPLAQFLAQRMLEKEQARVEGMQAGLLERQRLRREVRYYAALQAEHDVFAEEWRRQQEEARKAAEAEAEARRKIEEEARLKAEAEAEAEAEWARLVAEEEARQQAEERARLAAEEAERQAAEAARLEAEAAMKAEADEKARLEAAALEQRRAEERAREEAESARRQAQEAARVEAETRARLEAEERDRQQAEERARREADERARLEAEAARRAEAEAGERARREARNAAPRVQEPARRPPANVDAWPEGRPLPKPDGFWEMLSGESSPAN